MKVRNVELDFSITNLENIKKIENAYKKIQEDSETFKSDDFFEQMEHECKVGKAFFDEVFGEGTAQKLFGDENDFEVIMDSMIEVVEEIDKKKKALNSKMEKYSSKRVKR